MDFAAQAGGTLIAVDVRSGRRRDTQPGLTAFEERSSQPANSWWAVLLARAFPEPHRSDILSYLGASEHTNGGGHALGGSYHD
jgi:hypothetical protein